MERKFINFMGVGSTAAASGSNNIQRSSFTKVLTQQDVCEFKDQLTMNKQDFETHILPHLKPEERKYIRGKRFVDVLVIDDTKGTRCSMRLKQTANYYHIIGTETLVEGSNFQANQEIQISWRDNALHISY
ncbi:hypothetical protein SLE2022_063140 [Rubroshorea leprosula]